MPKREFNVGLIGHKFMGKAHSHALHDLPLFFPMHVVPVMKVVCGLEDNVEQFAAQYGWQKWTHAWREVVDDPAIHIVDIASPGNTHREIAEAAAQRGKHIFCEKPLACTLAEAREMHAAVERAKVKHLVNFNYRRVPAVELARQLIGEGRLGAVLQFRGTYQQDWTLDPAFPFVWRMDKSVAGAGSMADKGSHIIDLARYLAGEFFEVAAATEIFVKQRPLPSTPGAKRQVTTDDAAVFIARFQTGALGVFETCRMSAGHKNALQFEVNGSRGSVRFNVERLNELEVYFASDEPETQGFRTVMVTQPSHRYIENWWPPGHVIGWEHTFIHQYYEFLSGINEDRQPSPSFHDGLKAQAVIEAVETAAAERRWVTVDQKTAVTA